VIVVTFKQISKAILIKSQKVTLSLSFDYTIDFSFIVLYSRYSWYEYINSRWTILILSFGDCI